jgi:hypothetical protein
MEATMEKLYLVAILVTISLISMAGALAGIGQP